jgi:hypothetical protein
VEAVLGYRDRERWQLAELVALRGGRVEALCPPQRRAHEPQRSGHWSITSSTCASGSSRRCVPSCPGWPPGLRPLAGFVGRAGADGGSWEGGSEELRELRLRRCSSSATRASSRRFASISSPIRISSATAVSRSPSRIASASARSTPAEFGERSQVPSYVKAKNALASSLGWRSLPAQSKTPGG